MLQQLERKFRRLAIPNITIYLVIGQFVFYLALVANPALLGQMVLDPQLVLAGEIWRIFSFVFIPPDTHPVFVFFALYLFYLMGNGLEAHWGAFRYNLYLLLGYLATLASCAIYPEGEATNAYIGTSVFLAFAFLYPDFVLYLFFIIPVKIKWLALLTWIGYFLSVVYGGWLTRLLVLAATCNFLLFFWPDILRLLARGKRGMERQVAGVVPVDHAFHRCVTCGATERSHPQREFRYCPQCHGSPGYCDQHIHNHQHIASR